MNGAHSLASRVDRIAGPQVENPQTVQNPGVTLADARHLRDDARGLVSQKIDPLTARQEAERAARLNPTLQELTAQYMASATFRKPAMLAPLT